MPIKNYTTTIDVNKTVGEIHKILIKHGAKKLCLIMGKMDI
jgi:hypothetical protein